MQSGETISSSTGLTSSIMFLLVPKRFRLIAKSGSPNSDLFPVDLRLTEETETNSSATKSPVDWVKASAALKKAAKHRHKQSTRLVFIFDNSSLAARESKANIGVLIFLLHTTWILKWF